VNGVVKVKTPRSASWRIGVRWPIKVSVQAIRTWLAFSDAAGGTATQGSAEKTVLRWAYVMIFLLMKMGSPGPSITNLNSR